MKNMMKQCIVSPDIKVFFWYSGYDKKTNTLIGRLTLDNSKEESHISYISQKNGILTVDCEKLKEELYPYLLEMKKLFLHSFFKYGKKKVQIRQIHFHGGAMFFLTSQGQQQRTK